MRGESENGNVNARNEVMSLLKVAGLALWAETCAEGSDRCCSGRNR